MTATAVPIYLDQDFYVPRFEVKLEERKLEQEVVRDVLQVSYKDQLKQQLDSFEVTFNNWDEKKQQLKYSDLDLFVPGKKLELRMGYHAQGGLRRMIRGKITALRPNFPASGAPTLAVSGLSLLDELRTQQRSQTYLKLTDSQIAGQIAKRLGLDFKPHPAAEDEQEHPYVIQDNQYDIVFLWERARRLGYELFVEEDAAGGKSRLYFGPTVELPDGPYLLEYRKTLIQFQPDLDAANQVSEVVVLGWDPKRGKRIKATAKRAEIRNQGVGTKGGQAKIDKSFAQRKEIITNVGVTSEKEAKALARETLENIAKTLLRGRGSTVGLPGLRAGTPVLIEDLGDLFSGRYLVTASTHSLGDGGYTTQFECRREEKKK